MRARLLLLLAVLATALACRSTAPEPAPLDFELGLAFEGQQSFDAERLARVVREELARLEVKTPDKAAIDDAAFALELFYRSRGHAEVRVDYAFEPGDPPRARFTIDEGPELRVRSFTIQGPSALTPDTVRAAFEPMASGGLYDEDKLGTAIDRLRQTYRERGHLRVAIDPPVTRVEGNQVDVGIVLREGPAFVVRAVEFQGGVEGLAKVEREVSRQHTGKTYLPVVVPEIQHVLEEAYQHAGFPDVDVRVRPEPDESSGAVRIRVEIVPGERVRIAHFRLVGNERTRDAAILGVMGIELGSVYDSARLRDAFRDLYATGLFESVALTLEGTGPERTLRVEVSEARSVQIRLEPGYGSYEGPRILLGIEENNFRGRGQVVGLEGTLSLKARALRLSWVDRDFLSSSFAAETSFFVEQREEPSFTFLRRGFGFFLRRRWNQEWSTSTGYEFRPTNVTDDAFNTPLPPDLDSDTSVAALSTSVTFDDRDNPLAPTRGKQAHARFEWADDAFGSDTEFLRGQLDLSRLFAFGDDTVLAASARTGLIVPFGQSGEIPLPERFFNGGENSVRSFRENELLPEGRTGDPLGGEAATTLNLELRRELTGNLAGALFVDVGNVSEDVQDYLRFAGMRTGVGVGLRYLLPIGPVRLDFGVNPNPREEEDSAVLHFSVGFPF